MKTLAFVAGILLALLSGAANAQTTTIGDAGPGTWTVGRTGSMVGQTFTVPSGVDRLDSASLGVAANGAHGAWSLSLHRMTAGVPGPALVTDAAPSAPPGLPNYAMFTLTPVGGLPVTAGDVYLIRANLVSNLLVPVSSGSYPGGTVNFDGTADGTQDAYFNATFAATPAAVPTLSEWTMILLGLALAGGATWVMQRRRMTT